MSATAPVPLSRILPAHDQVASLGEAMGHLAHDFNNLLAAISGSASLIEMTSASTLPETVRHVRNIHAATSRGARIMQQLLTLSPRADAPFEPVKVADALREAKNAADSSFGASYPATFFAPDDLPALACDRRQLLLMLGIVVENARDAMPQGGAIVATARVKSLGGDEAALAGVAPGDYLALAVQDAGPGLDRAVMEKLGVPFFTTKPKNKGSGLGLAIANRVARRHRGFVRIDVEPGSGTRVTCHLRMGLPVGN